MVCKFTSMEPTESVYRLIIEGYPVIEQNRVQVACLEFKKSEGEASKQNVIKR